MHTPAPANRLPSRAGLWRWAAAALLLSWATGCASLPANVNRVPSTAFAQPDETPLGQLVQARRVQAAARSDSAFHVMEDVETALASRIALIEGATRSLDLQYYAIHADASTEVLLSGVREAARRGVRVRILIDDFNSVGEDAQVLRLAFEPNVEMRLFNPVAGSRGSMVGRIITSLYDFDRMQKRMHNKLFLADNAWGITGGRNLGDAYFGTSDKENFVDLDVLAAGRIVRDMSASFDRFWNDELAYPVQTLLDQKDIEALRKPQAAASAPQSASSGGQAASAPAPSLPVTASATVLPEVTLAAADKVDRPALDLRTVPLFWAPAMLLVDQPGKVGPGDDEVNAGDTVIDGLLSLMQAAQSDVLIVSPYFVPGEQMMGVYQQLRQRGVRIRVLTNSLASNDAPAAHAGYARYRKALLAMGVELYEMRSDPATVANLIGSHGGSSSSDKGVGIGLGSGPGGSKSGTQSRASLHSKAVFIDQRLAVIGSMNLDLRSQRKNSEVGLVIRSAALAQQATRVVEHTLNTGSYRLEQRNGHYFWRAPKGAAFPDSDSEPGASASLKLFVKLMGPFAPDAML